MARNIVIGLDIGAAAVRIMVAEVLRAGEVPKVLGVSEAPSLGLRRGAVVDQDEIAKSIELAVRDAERAAGVPVRHAYLGIGGTNLTALRSKGTVMVSRADNEIAEFDIRRAIESCQATAAFSPNKAVIHTHPIIYTVDQEIITRSPVGLFGTRLEAETFMTTGLNQHLKSIVKSVESAGVSVDDVIATPHAAAEAVLTKRQKEAGVALIDLGSDTTSIIVFEEGVPISLEVFPVGAAHITNDLAIGFQVPISEAEQLKCNFTALKNKVKFKDIVEARLSDIFELVNKHLKKIGRQRLLPAGVVLTGGGANFPGIADFVKKELQLPAEIGLPQNIRHNLERLQNPSWAVASGLCLLGAASFVDEFSYGTFGGAKATAVRWLKSFLP